MIGPFWRYYGGKHRAAPRYPQPRHGLIIEPFAGAAGYACRYPDRDVLLIDASPIIAGIWRWLIAATPADVLAVGDIPDGGTVDDIDAPQEARWLAGFWCNDATVNPSKRPSKWSRRGDEPHNWTGWNSRARSRIARDVPKIKHWRVQEGDYTTAPDIEACWFIDPPYSTKAGSYYPQQPADFGALGTWCRERRGQVIVCEQEGATWLPFEPFGLVRGAPSPTRPARNAEVYWTKGCEMQPGAVRWTLRSTSGSKPAASSAGAVSPASRTSSATPTRRTSRGGSTTRSAATTPRPAPSAGSGSRGGRSGGPSR